MLFLVRTKAKWERSLQQSNLKKKTAHEHHEILRMLIQAEAVKLQTVGTVRKGSLEDSLQTNCEYMKTSSSA